MVFFDDLILEEKYICTCDLDCPDSPDLNEKLN